MPHSQTVLYRNYSIEEMIAAGATVAMWKQFDKCPFQAASFQMAYPVRPQ